MKRILAYAVFVYHLFQGCQIKHNPIEFQYNPIDLTWSAQQKTIELTESAIRLNNAVDVDGNPINVTVLSKEPNHYTYSVEWLTIESKWESDNTGTILTINTEENTSQNKRTVKIRLTNYINCDGDLTICQQGKPSWED